MNKKNVSVKVRLYVKVHVFVKVKLLKWSFYMFNPIFFTFGSKLSQYQMKRNHLFVGEASLKVNLTASFWNVSRYIQGFNNMCSRRANCEFMTMRFSAFTFLQLKVSKHMFELFNPHQNGPWHIYKKAISHQATLNGLEFFRSPYKHSLNNTSATSCP